MSQDRTIAMKLSDGTAGHVGNAAPPSPLPIAMTIDPSHRVLLGGHELFTGTRAELIERLGDLVPADRVHTVITPNVDQTLLMREAPDLRGAYERATLRLADGAPLVLLARLLGEGHLHRLTGADLLVDIARVAAQHGWRIALTGSAPGVSAAAARRLTEWFGADAVAIDFPRIQAADDPAGRPVVDALVAAAPDFVFVCLGSPKQDVWADHWRAALPPAVYVGAGAAADFVAGAKRRAPRAVQRLGLEWAFRLLQEPRRLAYRYLVRGPRFLGVVARSVQTRGMRSR